MAEEFGVSMHWIFRPACIKSSSVHHGICQSSLEPVIALVVGLASEALFQKTKPAVIFQEWAP